MNNNRKHINVSIVHSDKSIKIIAGKDIIELFIQSPVVPNRLRVDFAVWFVLPIAMRRDADIVVQGAGSQSTANNARKISLAWKMWVPSKFSAVNVSFTESCDDDEHKIETDNLCFYSGGIDSTYSILKLHQEGQIQSLLTIHGMDYKNHDEERFQQLIDKTKNFSDNYGKQRLYVKTNAYNIYGQYLGVRFSHIFVLAGTAFMFSEHYKNITIAADHRLDQQSVIHPWGSNSITNRLFNDGSTFLSTVDDDITRSEKMPALFASKKALSSLSFCVNYESRPHNCGICSKCMRTKLMFLAATGNVPDIFISNEVNPDLLPFNLQNRNERAFCADLYNCAKNNNRLDLMPCKLRTLCGPKL
jgi:hypothetical protein